MNDPKEQKAPRTVNEGDIIDDSKTLEEKKQQIAVHSDNWDPAGQETVPTYFPIVDENGEEQVLHHVKDAEEISDVIRQARVDENGERVWD